MNNKHRTRLTVGFVMNLLAHGASEEEIMGGYTGPAAVALLTFRSLVMRYVSNALSSFQRKALEARE